MTSTPLYLLILATFTPAEFPPDNSCLYGFALNGYEINIDSADFSIATSEGIETKWSFYHGPESTLIENRDNSWLRYQFKEDSIFCLHQESTHEKSDFHFKIATDETPHVNTHPYLALTRRDITFTFIDTGQVKTTSFISPLLILADNDTIKNCPCIEIKRIYRRTLVGHDSVSTEITETERRWLNPGEFVPLAVTYSRSLQHKGTILTTVCEAITFPRQLNPDRNMSRAETINDAKNKNDIFENTTILNSKKQEEPTIDFNGRILKISSTGPTKIIVCDIAGIIYRRVSDIDGSIELNLEELRAGEYVVALNINGFNFAKTISINR